MMEEPDFVWTRKAGFAAGLTRAWATGALRMVGNRRGGPFRKNALLGQKKKKIHNNNKDS